MQRFASALRSKRRPRVGSVRQNTDTLACASTVKYSHLSRINRRSLHSTLPRPSLNFEQSEFKVPVTKNINEAGVVLHPDLKPYVRVSGCTDDHLANLDSGFTITFLGTGASLSPFRSQTSTALRMGGKTFLFDSGDGVQRQLMLSSVNLGEIEKIFSECDLSVRVVPHTSLSHPCAVTHLHGDHVFGLPGLLLFLQVIASVQQTTEKTIQIYGPAGIHNFIAMTLSLSAAELKLLRVEVYELIGGSCRWRHPGIQKSFAEFRHRGLIRKSIPRNADGTWTIMTPPEVTSQEEADRAHSNRYRGLYITAAEVEHTPKLQCVGYVIEEPKTQSINIDSEKATSLGLKPSIKYKALKWGFPVPSDDDESRLIHPEDVMIGEKARPRKLAILGDCYAVPPVMAQMCRGADVILHEATLSEEDTGSKVVGGGHSSAAMAGMFANEVKPHVLAMVHHSPTIRNTSSVKARIAEARRRIGRDGARVLFADDLMELVVPRSGFHFNANATKEVKTVKEVERTNEQIV